MIQQQKVGSINCLLAEFGTGEILVTSLLADVWAGISLKSHEKREIGESDESWRGKTTDELEPDIILSFTRQESIDVLIEKLLEAKNNLSKLHIAIASSDKISIYGKRHG